MGKLDRQLARIPPQDRQEIERITEKIVARDLSHLDVKKLKGQKNVFRARKGSFRIIFEFSTAGANILAIERRREDTYRRV